MYTRKRRSVLKTGVNNQRTSTVPVLSTGSASDDFGTVRKLTVNLHMNLLYFRRTVSFLTTVAWKVSPDSEFSQYWLKLQWITGLYSHTHAHTCIATQVYDLKSGYVGGPGLLKSRV